MEYELLIREAEVEDAAKQNELPNTGSKENTTFISLGLVAGLLSVLTFGKKRKED